MENTFNEWVNAFEAELNRRFATNIKLVVLQNTQQQTMMRITQLVANCAGLNVQELFNKRRGLAVYSDARMVAMYYIYLNTRVTKSDIAKFFGRNHTTVLSAIITIKNRIATNDSFCMPLITNVGNTITQQKPNL